MSAEFVSAIDNALAYVREHPYPITMGELEQFDELADKVYRFALAEGLVQALPQVSELRPELESNDPPLPPVRFESKLNLPGDWDYTAEDRERITAMPMNRGLFDEIPTLPEKVFDHCAPPRWWHDMEVLRSLAVGESPVRLLEAMSDDAMMTHVDLAEALGLDRETLRNKLRRWQKGRLDGYQEISNPKQNEPKYLYRVGAVRTLLSEALKQPRPASARPKNS